MWIHCKDQLTIDASQSNAGLAERIKKQWSYFTDGGPALVEKSPANLLRLRFLQAHFQPASFIYIVRNS